MDVLASLLVFVGLSTCAAAVFAAVVEALTIPAAGLALILGAAAAFYCWRISRSLSVPSLSRPDLLDVLALSAFAIVALRHFLWLYFERDGVVRTLNPNNYGDLPLHVTYVAHFVKGGRFWPENPIFTGELLRYPFGVDLFTAMLVKVGIPLEIALPALGLAGAAAFALALFAWGRGFAVAAFLFSGGLAGFAALWTGVLRDYQAELAWKNLFLALFVPQRGFLFAFPAGLVLLWSWKRRILRGETALPPMVEGLLWGTMPLFHIHSFLFLSVIFALWVAAQRAIKAALPAFLWAVVPATWCVAQLTSAERTASFVWWKPGWLIGTQSPLVFLAVNFGFFLAVAVWATAAAIGRKNREHLLLLVPALGVFAVLFFVMLAPAEWDNTKVMAWCYLLALPAMSELGLDRLRRPLRALTWAVLCFSGLVCVVHSLRGRGYEVVRVEERDEVCRAVAGLPANARVATMQTFNHPVALCGQALVAGYGGHLWSHGIASAPVEERLRALMMGEGDWRAAARDLGARYLFWGVREATDFAGSTRPWESTAVPVARGRFGTLYRIPDR